MRFHSQNFIKENLSASEALSTNFAKPREFCFNDRFVPSSGQNSVSVHYGNQSVQAFLDVSKYVKTICSFIIIY